MLGAILTIAVLVAIGAFVDTFSAGKLAKLTTGQSKSK